MHRWRQKLFLNGQPTILPSGAAFDVISLFKSILNQQFSYFHGVTIKTACQVHKQLCSQDQRILL